MLRGLLKRKIRDEYSSEFQERSIHQCDYVVVDTELTGLDQKNASIVSIGAVKMKGTRIIMSDIFYEIVRPSSEITAESILIHGITPTETAGKPSIGSVISDFLVFCKGCVIAGHFVVLDTKVINNELKKHYGCTLDNPIIDTYKIYDWLNQNEENFSRHFLEDREKDLFSIAKNYEIRTVEAHNALMDAFITAQILQRFLVCLPILGIKTIKALLRIGGV
mgnify:CR=1 FL=1